MQDRYVGDIGDYVKIALLRHLGIDQKLGIAWYLHPDEGHNEDGKHTSYLADPGKWRDLDPPLFDALTKIVADERSVGAIQDIRVLPAYFFSERITSSQLVSGERSEWRLSWFRRVKDSLSDCDLVFADPDNGLTDDNENRRRDKNFGKQMPLSEALALSAKRPAVIYHHNTRRKGGHDAEVDFWINKLGSNTIAVRANAYSARTFFIINPSAEITDRTIEFCDKWAEHKVWLHLERTEHKQMV